MRDVQQSSSNKRVVLMCALASYPKLFKPELAPNAEPGAKPKYGMAIVLPPDDHPAMVATAAALKKKNPQFILTQASQIAALKKAASEVLAEKFGGAEKAAELVRAGKVRLPFRTDDEKYPAGSVFINARTTDRPGVVSRFIDPATGKAKRITEESQTVGNPDEIYPGAVVAVAVTAFGYDQRGNKGVSFALNNVQKIGDGERLDSRVKPEDEFEADMSETPASLDGAVAAPDLSALI